MAERGVALLELVHAGLQQAQPHRHLVASRLADGGQHLAGHPVLERPRLLQLGGEDEGIETALVDECCFLGSAKGVAFRDPLIFVIYMLTQGIACIAKRYTRTFSYYFFLERAMFQK